RLREQGVAGPDAFRVGSTLTVPLHDRTARDALVAIDGLGLAPSSIGTRAPTLDDVYLRLTGDRLAHAARKGQHEWRLPAGPHPCRPASRASDCSGRSRPSPGDASRSPRARLGS